MPEPNQLQEAADRLEGAAAALDSATQVVREAEAALPAAVLGVFALMVVVGIVLWLVGGRLAKAACVLSGMVMGGVGGWLIGATLADQGAYVLPLVIGGSIIGALLAGLLFRVWIAGVGAAVLALVVPVASLVWQGATVDPVSFDQQAVVDQTLETAEGEDSPTLMQKVNRAMDAVYTQLADDAEAWWESLGGSGRTIVYMGALIGAAVGLLLGMVLPKVSAALQTALAGALLVYFGAMGLARWQLGEDSTVLPDSARGAVVAIGLITLLGTVIQWTLSRRQADK